MRLSCAIWDLHTETLDTERKQTMETRTMGLILNKETVTTRLSDSCDLTVS